MTVLAKLTPKQLTTGLDYAVNNHESPGFLKPAQFIKFAHGGTDSTSKNFGSRLDNGKWDMWTDDQGRAHAFHPDIPGDKHEKR